MKHLILPLLLCISLTAFTQGVAVQNTQVPLETLYQKALTKISAYQFEDALKLLSQCYIRDQYNITFINQIAYCHAQQGRYPDAKLYYKETLKVDSVNVTAMSSLGRLYEQERNYKTSLPYYQQLVQLDSTNSYYHKRLAYNYSKLGDMFSGINAFLKAYEFNPRDIEVIEQLSDVYLRTQNYEFAKEMLQKGLYTDPNNIKLLYVKARLHKHDSEHEGVIETVTQAMSQGDTSNYYQMILGVAYLYLDSLNQSVFHLQELVNREKDTEHTHHYLGVAYHKMDSLERSAEHFELAIEKGISSKIDMYYADLGSIAEEQKKYKKAIAYYEKAYSYDPKDEYLFHLGHNYDLYYKDKKIALRYYQQYVDSVDQKYRKYATDRIERLKELIHFQR
ncbi:MAG: tetratricopeptide repeat protein [Bacteroidota bacterium]